MGFYLQGYLGDVFYVAVFIFLSVSYFGLPMTVHEVNLRI